MLRRREPPRAYSGFDMKRTHLSIIVTLLAVTSLRAADPVNVPWNKLCQAARGGEMRVTTVTGDTVDGYCVAIDVNQLSVTTKDKGIVKIARTALSRLEVNNTKGHQLRALHKDVHKGLTSSLDDLLSPKAPIGIVGVPLVLGWGAVAAPFCLLGDLRSKLVGKRELKPI